ncbi:MAG TPA: DUF6249 domain-containing protein, partial [Bacteroidota bacterium]|nr:DUF6249 domain-containing protein [Bacteroidota bacterium]
MPGEVAIIPLIFFAVLGAVIIIGISTRHKERMSMIEKGMPSEDIKALYTPRQYKRDPLSSLKWGLLFVLAGVAILLTNYLHTQYGMEEGAGIGIVMLFVGIGLVV